LTAIQGLNEERRKEEPMNIGTLPTRHARWRPDHIAVVFEDQRLTWCQFNQRVNRLANAFLNLGISEGDMIATILPNASNYWKLIGRWPKSVRW
jgi:acyl-CoA synthetase (AMP-forming)/AMP-acid ligase II